MKELIYCFVCDSEFEAGKTETCPYCRSRIWGNQVQSLADRNLSQYDETEKTQEVSFRWSWRRKSRRRI